MWNGFTVDSLALVLLTLLLWRVTGEGQFGAFVICAAIAVCSYLPARFALSHGLGLPDFLAAFVSMSGLLMVLPLLITAGRVDRRA